MKGTSGISSSDPVQRKQPEHESASEDDDFYGASVYVYDKINLPA